MTKKQCEYCEKEFEIRRNIYGNLINQQKYCSSLCNDKAYYYRNHEKRKKYGREYHQKNYGVNEHYTNYQKSYLKKWYQKNKERQKENTLRDYYRNKNRWMERKFVNRHKDQILSILPKKCFSCGKKEIKEIHHKNYDMKRTSINPGRIGHPEEYYKEYCKNLLGFCSRDCHRGYERINKRNVSTFE